MSRPTLPTCKARNWPSYNAALERLGPLTIWFDPDRNRKAAPTSKRCRQPDCGDAAIQTCQTMKVQFGTADRQTANGGRPKVIGVRISAREPQDFDAALARYCVAHRSDALRFFFLAAYDILHPDDAMTEALRSKAAHISRVGNNINQVARRLNEAKLKVECLPYTAESHGNNREFACLVLDMADQLQALLVKRRADLIIKFAKALASPLPDREHRGQ